MKNYRALTMMAVLGLVAGCNSNSAEKSNGAAAANGASAAPSSSPAGEAPVTQAALVGTWGQDNCTNTMTFNEDGTAASTSAQQADNRWSVDGSTIVITSPGEPDVRMPAVMKNNELHLTGGGGEGASAVLTRCPAGSEGGAADEGGE